LIPDQYTVIGSRRRPILVHYTCTLCEGSQEGRDVFSGDKRGVRGLKQGRGVSIRGLKSLAEGRNLRWGRGGEEGLPFPHGGEGK
jgi:hypothetical protein